MNRIEALADAICAFNQALNPESDAYRLRNPGLLRSYQFKTLLETDEKARRKFSSFIGGYRALVDDIQGKITGKRRGVKGDRILRNLLSTYRAGHDAGIFEIVDFIQRALSDETISADTPLEFFLEMNNGRTNSYADTTAA